jgi:hypothetical protein
MNNEISTNINPRSDEIFEEVKKGVILGYATSRFLGLTFPSEPPRPPRFPTLVHAAKFRSHCHSKNHISDVQSIFQIVLCLIAFVWQPTAKQD